MARGRGEGRGSKGGSLQKSQPLPAVLVRVFDGRIVRPPILLIRQGGESKEGRGEFQGAMNDP